MSDLTLLDHIISQTRQNIELLLSHNRLSQSDARNILSRLPTSHADSPSPVSIASLTQQTQQLKMSPTQSVARSADSHAPPKEEARAIWEWTSEDPNDLSFHVGEIIEIVDEANADWWMGRNKTGKKGLFPSVYVERLGPPRPVSPSTFPRSRPSQDSNYGLPAPKYSSPPGPPQYSSPPSVQQQYYPPPHGHPPVGQGGYMPPPGPPYNNSYPGNPPVAQPAPQQPPKNGRFGNLGATMAQSAAGGLGFGAGAAIGSDVINSIF